MTKRRKRNNFSANSQEKPFREPIAHMKSLGGSRTSNHGALWLYCKKTGPKKPKKFGVRGNALLNPIAISISHPYVAPRAGAWIETPPSKHGSLLGWVAPRAGAWIETSYISRSERKIAAQALRRYWQSTGDWRKPSRKQREKNRVIAGLIN